MASRLGVERCFTHVALPRIGSLAILALAATLVGCTGEGPAYGPPSAGSAATVTATNNLDFEPRTLRVAVGDTVEWRNKSLFSHTVTLTAEKGAGNEGMELPDDAEPFDADLPPGQLFRHTFNVPGTYRYICEPHAFLGMRGTVVATPRD